MLFITLIGVHGEDFGTAIDDPVNNVFLSFWKEGALAKIDGSLIHLQALLLSIKIQLHSVQLLT